MISTTTDGDGVAALELCPLALALCLAAVLALALPARADWVQWRGPHGNGVGEGENLPEEWAPRAVTFRGRGWGAGWGGDPAVLR